MPCLRRVAVVFGIGSILYWAAPLPVMGGQLTFSSVTKASQLYPTVSGVSDAENPTEARPHSGTVGMFDAAVFSLFDRIGVYQKNGVFESFGATVRQRPAGPISIRETVVNVTHARALLFWRPDFAQAYGATAI